MGWGARQTTLIAQEWVTRYIVWVRIGDPASKHGVAESDVVHAMSNAVRHVVMDEGFTMLIGPAEDGTLLEVGILDFEGGDPVVIHAMALRQKFYQFLG